MSLTSIKQQFARNRSKTIVLAILSVAFVGLVIQALLSTKPRAAAARPVVPTTLNSSATSDPQATAEMEERLHQSRQLWEVLREERGSDPITAFTFDPAYYNRDPSLPPINVVVPPKIEVQTEKSDPKTSDEQNESSRQARVRQEATTLHLQSTVMAGRQMAVINGEIVRVGENILGFRVVAIRPGEILVEKDGVSLTLEMGKN